MNEITMIMDLEDACSVLAALQLQASVQSSGSPSHKRSLQIVSVLESAINESINKTPKQVVEKVAGRISEGSGV